MELLVSSDEYDDNVSVIFWNPSSGTKLLTLRGPPGIPNTLDLIKNEGFAIGEIGKPFIHFWQNGQSLQTSRRILCPGKPCAVAVYPDGNYFAVAIEEKIHVWHVCAGRIVTSLSSAHFRPVTVLQFSSNGKYLVSGGADGVVNAWNAVHLIGNQSFLATETWSDHSLPVTALQVGVGQKPSIFTCSLDRTCKVYSLLSGSLLLSISFPISLTALAVDKNETAVYVGSKNGTIYQINLLTPSRSLEQVIMSDAAADSVFKKKHNCQITCITIAADGRNLASGDEAGNIYVWDVCSKQAVRTIQEVQQSATSGSSGGTTRNISRKVSNLKFCFTSLDNLKGAQKPTICFPEVPKLLDSQENSGSGNTALKLWNRTNNSQSAVASETEVSRSQLAEISRLKMELEKQEKINEKLKEFCIKSALYSSAPHDPEPSETPVRRTSKRARISRV